MARSSNMRTGRGLDPVIDLAEQVSRERGEEAAQRYYALASGKGLSLEDLFARYHEARKDEMSPGWERELQTEKVRLRKCVTELDAREDTLPDLKGIIVADDITRDFARHDVHTFLPNIETARGRKGLSRASIVKSPNINAGMFTWAIEQVSSARLKICGCRSRSAGSRRARRPSTATTDRETCGIQRRGRSSSRISKIG